MRLNVEKKTIVTSLWLALSLSLATSISFADGFYTIIGPDGHPMIVQKPEPKQKTTLASQSQPKEKDRLEQPIVIQKNNDYSEKKVDLPVIQSQPSNKSSNSLKQANQISTVNSLDQKTVQSNQAKDSKVITQMNKDQNIKGKLQSEALTQNLDSSQKIKDKAKNDLKLSSNETATNTKIDQNQFAKTKVMERPTVPAKEPAVATTEDEHYTEIDGVKYVSSEYLEDREFNLEGKKRFYMTPEVGSSGRGRYETIERKKGVSASLLERIRNKSEPEEHKAVVLSTNYFRLPKDEVIKNLEQACFSGKKVTKAKSLSIKNQELGLWPVAPIKEHFAYEVVKLDGQVQNVLLTSYASSSKDQTYYWPLVVFLDQKGCVLEGVSGFKNEESTDNNMQYAAMEGILRKPENAAYMFLTPLSSAVDVENRQLTNHGQIKLSVIQ